MCSHEIYIKGKSICVNALKGGCSRFCVSGFRLSERHAFFKLGGEAVERCFPVPLRHRPFLADVVERQIKQLADGVVSGK